MLSNDITILYSFTFSIKIMTPESLFAYFEERGDLSVNVKQESWLLCTLIIKQLGYSIVRLTSLTIMREKKVKVLCQIMIISSISIDIIRELKFSV